MVVEMAANQLNDLNRAYARCARITRSSSSNFYYAFMLLPAARRRALYAVYAFCRFVDDIADDAGGPLAPAACSIGGAMN